MNEVALKSTYPLNLSESFNVFIGSEMDAKAKLVYQIALEKFEQYAISLKNKLSAKELNDHFNPKLTQIYDDISNSGVETLTIREQFKPKTSQFPDDNSGLNTYNQKLEYWTEKNNTISKITSETLSCIHKLIIEK
jgi:hypothetical protein